MSYIAASFDDEVIALLTNGGVGLVPTDTIYGLSCMAFDEEAVERIYQLKKRDQDKPPIVLVSSYDQLRLLKIDIDQVEFVKNFWPGPLTAKFDNRQAPSWLLKGSGTIAVRWPSSKALQALIYKVGPLVGTSANIQGDDPAKSAAQARSVFGEALDFYVDVGELEGQASTIVKVENGKLRVIRQGEVKIDDA